MTRTRLVLATVLALLCVPAAQTVASAIGLGAVTGERVDVAAQVYANVSDAACGWAFDTGPASFSYVYACATDEHARLDYAASDDSVPAPQNAPGSRLVIYASKCDAGYQCTSRHYFGPMPEGALSVDPLLRTATIKTTVDANGAPCLVDLAFVTPNGPTAGNQQWSHVDPRLEISLTAAARAGAAITSTGTMGGTACGLGAGDNGWGSVSHGADLFVGLFAKVTPEG